MDAGSSRRASFYRPLTPDVDVNDIEDVESDFIHYLKADKAETYYCARRYLAKECLFAGYRCDDVRKSCILSGHIHETLEKSFAINYIAVHGLKAICVVIMPKDVVSQSIGPFYRGYSKDEVMFHLTYAIMSEVADLAECSSHKDTGMPFAVVSVKDFRGKITHEVSCDPTHANSFLRDQLSLSSGSDYTLDKTIEAAISAFQRLYPQELTAEDLYVCVCEDIELAAYDLMPHVIQDFLKRGSS